MAPTRANHGLRRYDSTNVMGSMMHAATSAISGFSAPDAIGRLAVRGFSLSARGRAGR